MGATFSATLYVFGRHECLPSHGPCECPSQEDVLDDQNETDFHFGGRCLKFEDTNEEAVVFVTSAMSALRMIYCRSHHRLPHNGRANVVLSSGPWRHPRMRTRIVFPGMITVRRPRPIQCARIILMCPNECNVARSRQALSTCPIRAAGAHAQASLPPPTRRGFCVVPEFPGTHSIAQGGFSAFTVRLDIGVV